MRQITYFILPVLAGWSGGVVTCLAVGAMDFPSMPTLEDLATTATIAGIFIVAPTYLFFVLPYSCLCRRYFREHNNNLPWWPLCLLLIVFGGTITVVPLFQTFGEHVSFTSINLTENPALFFLPFIPYSVLVAWLMSRLTKWTFAV
jgi:hypothetical protein